MKSCWPGAAPTTTSTTRSSARRPSKWPDLTANPSGSGRLDGERKAVRLDDEHLFRQAIDLRGLTPRRPGDERPDDPRHQCGGGGEGPQLAEAVDRIGELTL